MDSTTMRSSFYSMGSVDDITVENANHKSQKCLSKLNIKNILELSQSELGVVREIKKFMQEQVQELQQEIQLLHDKMFEGASKAGMEDSDEDIAPTQQELKEFSNKLKVSLTVCNYNLGRHVEQQSHHQNCYFTL